MKNRLFKIIAFSVFIGIWIGCLGTLIVQMAQKQKAYDMQIKDLNGNCELFQKRDGE